MNTYRFHRYISRVSPRDNTRHVILSTASYRPLDFASQLNVSLANGWGIIRAIIDLCMKHPEGKYVLVKDPNKVRSRFPFSSLLQIATPPWAIRPISLGRYPAYPLFDLNHVNNLFTPWSYSRLSAYIPSPPTHSLRKRKRRALKMLTNQK